MRYSYSKRILQDEQRRRGAHHTREARVRQLKYLTAFLLSLYAVCAYNIWRHPRPVHHVWIDDVLVEVIEVNWIDQARTMLLYAGLACAALLTLVYACCGVPTYAATPSMGESAEGVGHENCSTEAQRRFSDPAGLFSASSARSSLRDAATLEVPAWARPRRTAAGSPTPVALHDDTTAATTSTAAAAIAAAAAADRARTFDPQRPARTLKDLQHFLSLEAAREERQRQRLAASDGVGVRYRGAVGGTGGTNFLGVDNFASGGVGASGGIAGGDGQHRDGDADGLGRGGIPVLYERRTRPHANGSPRGGLSSNNGGGGGSSYGNNYGAAGRSSGGGDAPTLPWAELGIFHLEESLQRTREWVSGVCEKLMRDVAQCDEWFKGHGIEAYDCHHSLQEVMIAPQTTATAPTMTGVGTTRPGGLWGATTTSTAGGGFLAASAAPAAPQMLTKATALQQEKTRCRQEPSAFYTLDTALRYDQRLSLEGPLDVSGTFPTPSKLSNAELQATREYVIERLRTFAKQRGLVSFNASGGDPETWRSGFPCDAHLLLHVLRYAVKGLSEYVRFGYQTGTQTEDLALYVGDTGEPYFYVRFRQGSAETLLSTRQGQTSLFEAVLAFAAVIHTYCRDVFGGVRGTVDLNEVGLQKVVAEGRRSG